MQSVYCSINCRMKKPILSLPCSQRIEDLKSNRPGYHCNLCEKQITDFRAKSNDEILQTIQEAPGKVCGIFNASQTTFKVSRVFLPRLSQSVGLSLMGILGFMGPVLTSCEQEPADQAAIKMDAFKKLKFPMNLNGQLTDKKTHKPIPHASVELVQHGKKLLRTITDENGNFSFFIQRNDLKDETFDLTFGANGYASNRLDDFLLKGKNNGKRIQLTLQANPEQAVKLEYCSITTAGVPIVDGLEYIPDPPLVGDVIPEIETPEPVIQQKDRPVSRENTSPKTMGSKGKDAGNP